MFLCIVKFLFFGRNYLGRLGLIGRFQKGAMLSSVIIIIIWFWEESQSSLELAPFGCGMLIQPPYFSFPIYLGALHSRLHLGALDGKK